MGINFSKSPLLQAFADLFKRYGAAFSHAWQHRAEMQPTERLPHEAQFLPAALSLQETPVSPAPRVAMWMLIGFAVLALLWAIFGKIEVVATAQGKVVPNDRTKTIQPFETATVKAIHVTDGQQVRAGDVLIELDATMAQADLERLQSILGGVRLQVARGQAMLAALDTGQPLKLIRPNGVDEAKFAEAQRLLAGQMAEFSAKQSRIEAETAKREAELRSTQELVNKFEQTVPIARQRAQDFKNLVNQDFVSKHGYLEREQVRIEQEADLANLRSRLKEIEAALRDTRSLRAAMMAETRRINLDSITEGHQNVAALEQELLKAGLRGKLMRLTSPVDGTVQQLAVHTVGGVLTPAQPLMIIVPRDNPLEVEAFLENKDIGFVKPNLDAEVKIETFQYTKYGTIHAKVTSVSHDAINDEKRGLIYSTRVKMEKSSINVDGTPVSLSPGMAVSVEIKTGKRRVIEYFLTPLMQHARESLRER
ncbi:MAG: HlyD family type I secretion periplasmic adaptor subunit [Limnohabitans sp.]|jgi:hemolysin D|uniref:HlyD family type I secretion periplasmic adaptor subunit n=1 Tax=Limnohabitans sp. TaxID=1907725 RepID=UPI0025F4C1D0|nr:HlyD family type I secretion periplasmic adaptor subunit [Limnohabitans sp.]MCO4089659.1 HlyD family type I secretion periplasmic adaptor subunit [Limnohabitans sp.]